MAIAINKNTSQQPGSVAGRTGTQSTKWIPAPRLYVKAVDSTTAAPVQTYYTKSNGVTPAGWTDLGVVSGNAKLTYNKKVKEVKTGLDNYLRYAYTDEKVAHLDVNLNQFDDIALENISGLTASIITAGSVINYQIGQEDLTPLAVLLVVQNKLDSKEWQFYNPQALFDFTFEEQGDALTLKASAILPFFVAAGQTKETVFSMTDFA